MTRRAIAALAVAALAAGCAPLAPYGGALPAPGAIVAFSGGDSPAGEAPAAGGPRARLVPGTTDAAHRFAGELRSGAPDGRFVVLLYGDNRPGFRMEANSPAYAPVKRMTLSDPGRLARGLAWLPVFLVNALLPALDGPRDLVTLFTHHPSGGGERRVLRALEAQLPADLAITTGDVVQDGRRGRQWEEYAGRTLPLRSRVLLFGAPGNHERMHHPDGAAGWSAVMGAPAAPGRWWYALDVPECGARFVFLDSNVLTDVRDRVPDAAEAALSEEQLAWADSALSGTQRLKFVVFHHPLVAAGHYLTDWGGDRDTPAARRRARLLQMFARRGVTATITGHEHLYHRAWVSTPAGGFWHVTTAGGGAPLYRLDRAARERGLALPLPAGFSVPRASVLTRSVYNFCRLELPRAGAPDDAPRLVAYAVGAGGAIAPLDSLALSRGPGAP